MCVLFLFAVVTFRPPKTNPSAATARLLVKNRRRHLSWLFSNLIFAQTDSY